jgi:hypothetical protein
LIGNSSGNLFPVRASSTVPPPGWPKVDFSRVCAANVIESSSRRAFYPLFCSPGGYIMDAH